MRVSLLFLAGAALALSGCDTEQMLRNTASRNAVEVCTVKGSEACNFANSPVRLTGDPIELPKRPYEFFRTAQVLEFRDASGRVWEAPAATLTDGASIPQIFISIIGDPRSPEFVNAAAVHDAYCGIGNESAPNYQIAKWRDVHRMFYEGLMVSGTERIRASLMYAAVYLGGPRWDTPRYLDLTFVPDAAKVVAMRQAKAFIEREDPDFATLQAFLEQQERAMLAEYGQREGDGGGSSSDH